VLDIVPMASFLTRLIGAPLVEALQPDDAELEARISKAVDAALARRFPTTPPEVLREKYSGIVQEVRTMLTEHLRAGENERRKLLRQLVG
jgi:hypothetical protein